MKRHLRNWRWVFIGIGLFAILALSGCTTVPRVATLSTEPLRLDQQPLGVVILVPEKGVEFFEAVQIALIGIKTVSNLYTFAGIWDPAPVFAKNLLASLPSGCGVSAVPLWEHLDEKSYGELVAACEAAFNEARTRKEAGAPTLPGLVLEMAGSPPTKYLGSPPIDPLKGVRERAGTDLVLEISIAGMAYYRGKTVLFSVGKFWLCVYGRIIRLSDGQVLRYSQRIESVIPKHPMGSFSEIEKDALAPLKEDYERALAKILRADGPFLKELLR